MNINDIKYLKELIEQLEIDYYELIDKEGEYDFEDLEKTINNIKIEIKSVVDSWNI